MPSKYAVPMDTVRLVRRIQVHILEVPTRLNMQELVRQHEMGFLGDWEKKNLPECGTVACIAGWGDLLSGSPRVVRKIAKRAKLLVTSNQKIWNRARRLLALRTSTCEYQDLLEELNNNTLAPRDREKALKRIAKRPRATDFEMFYERHWPEPFRSRYLREIQRSHETGRPRYGMLVRIASQRLDHYLYTGK